MAYKIALINMPFASLDIPSLALTQLKSVLESQFGERVAVEVFYLNHDFAHYLGLELYKYFILTVEGFTSGVGEWFFRQAAFPQLTDNSEEYLRRFYPRRDEQTETFKRIVREKRLALDGFLDELIARYGLNEAQIVGFTSLFHQNVASFALARKLKACHPQVVTVMGGANCEVPMGDAIVKNIAAIDFAFSGPSLKSFPRFVRHCLEGEMEQCHGIDGVFSKQNRVRWPPETAPDGQGYVSAIGEELDINTPIPLDYGPFLDALEKNFPDGGVEKVLLFETSRGCWWGEHFKCTFCGFNGMNMGYRAMEPERAIEQFEALFEYAHRKPRLWAVDNAMPRHYPQDVFAHLDTPPEIVIGYESKVNVKEKDVQMLWQAKVRGIQPGIESLATSTLKLMRKGATAFQNLTFLKYCVLYDLSPRWNILVGFPGEEEDVYRKYLHDIPLLMHLPPPTGVYPIRFDRYSHYFCHPEQYGLDLHPNDYYELTYPFGEEVLKDLAYYFVDDQNFKADYFKTMIKWLGKVRQKFEVWWQRWHGDDSGLLPQLLFKGQGESVVVYDTRASEAVEHPVGEVGRQVLTYLEKPRRIVDLAAALGHLPGFDPEKEVARLQERGLLFQEEERYLSLVLPGEPAQLTLFSHEARRVKKASLTRGVGSPRGG